VLHLTEYRSSRVEVSDRDLEYLLALVKGTGAEGQSKIIEAIAPTSDAGVYDIRPGGFVGRLGLPSGESLDIGSRFEFDDLIALIMQSRRGPIRTDDLVAPGGEDRFLIDVLARVFAREVSSLVAAGLAKSYRSHRFDRPPYPGRIDINLHLSRYAGRADRLVTTARRISVDVEINRALALALDVLSRTHLSDASSRSVAMLGAAFARVGRRPMSPGDVGRISLTRLTTRYRSALTLAEMILRSSAIAPRSTDLAGSSIVFNMPKVWEDLVARTIAVQYGEGYRIEAPYPFNLTADGSLSSEADVTVWEDDRLVALFDAKYKSLGSTPTMGDVYQMVAYCTRLGIDEATLVYPGRGEQKEFCIEDVTVRMWGLPVISSSEPMSLRSVEAAI